jgi:hypothetical protein
VLVVSGDVESSKPGPDLVEAALDKIGVPVRETVLTGPQDLLSHLDTTLSGKGLGSAVCR